MRKHSAGLAAIILAVFLGSFSLPSSAKNARVDWSFVKTEPDGTPLLYDIFTSTVQMARAHFDCPTAGSYYCARQCDSEGFPIAGGIVISRN